MAVLQRQLLCSLDCFLLALPHRPRDFRENLIRSLDDLASVEMILIRCEGKGTEADESKELVELHYEGLKEKNRVFKGGC